MAPEPAPALPEDAVEVGRVIGAWGIKGAIRIKPLAADPQALFSSKRWYLLPTDAALPSPVRPRSPLPALLKIVTAREQGEWIVATAQELPDRDAAEAVRGARVFISRASFPTPDADEFYWVDLIGMTVVNSDGRTLGRVVDLIETGPHCVLRVQTQALVDTTAVVAPAADAADELLIPFVSAYVGEVDSTARRINVDWQDDY
jgi:16S rRNA processing protein RimM